MAKGDDARARNRIDQQGGLAQSHLDNLRNVMINQQYPQMWNNFVDSTAMQRQNYEDIFSNYGRFAETGGYTPDQLSNIRSRAISPIRSMYANAQRNVDRQRSLQGGYSPGYGALQSRMAREGSSAMSDATTNAEAQIAQMVHSGKLAGLAGMSNIYGTTPAQAALFGNQALQSMGQQLQTQGLQNQLGLGLIGSQISASQLPGKWENTFGRIRDVAGLAGGAIYPWLNTGGNSMIRQNTNPGINLW